MKRPDDQKLPAPVPNLAVTPSREFTTQELEAVIRRALELQSGSSALNEGRLSASEVVRIGEELGVDPATVRRAMAEVHGRPEDERSALVNIAGARTVRASRVLRRTASDTALLLDSYLRESELMVPQRRFPDRTRYVRDSSLAAGFARFTRGFSRPHQPLNLQEVDVTVAALDAESCMLEVSVDLAGMRGGVVAGVLGSSVALTAGWVVTVWATTITDPLMLLGIPFVAGSWFGMRAIYSAIRKSVEDKLESFVDRVEHNDIK
jgi:hypothetical protein